MTLGCCCKVRMPDPPVTFPPPQLSKGWVCWVPLQQSSWSLSSTSPLLWFSLIPLNSHFWENVQPIPTKNWKQVALHINHLRWTEILTQHFCGSLMCLSFCLLLFGAQLVNTQGWTQTRKLSLVLNHSTSSDLVTDGRPGLTLTNIWL
jgi:hypothetical protein